MLLAQNIPVNITPESLRCWESDFKDDFVDAIIMEDSGTEFAIQDEQKDDDKDKDQEANNSISDRNQSLQAIVNDSTKDNDTNTKVEKINESCNVVGSAAKSKGNTLKEIGLSLQGLLKPKKNTLNSTVRCYQILTLWTILSNSLRSL